MKNQDFFLPDPDVYIREMQFFPWGQLIQNVLHLISQKAPKRGSILDLMCGPGQLLGRLKKKRPDLELYGVDCDWRYIPYAMVHNPGIRFTQADVRTWDTQEWNMGMRFDYVVCTAGIHHLPYKDQASFIAKLKTFLKPGGTAICADRFIAPYKTERERKRNAAAFGYQTLLAVLEKNPPEDIVQAAVDIIRSDVLGWEYKTSLAKLEPVFHRHFSSVQSACIWKPEDIPDAGDYLFILHE
ncbi:MAG: class I SAM-dependent methyltransferase [Patescibacteria group bacterium]|jgi:SAM-dependent methyltransferase